MVSEKGNVHSLTDEIVESIMAAGCQGKQTATFFLDVERAFDRVWHECLLFKFKEFSSLTATFIVELEQF